MARTYARIDVKRPLDPDWRALTCRQQAVYDFLLSNPKLSLCGALDVKLGSWSGMSADMDATALVDTLSDLEASGYIGWDRTTDEVVLRTFVRHDGVLQNQNLGKGMWSAWHTLESPALRQFVVDNLPEKAWEPRFDPPDSAVKNHRSNHRCEGRIEAPDLQPQPQLDPSSAERSTDRFEHVSVENAGPTVRIVS